MLFFDAVNQLARDTPWAHGAVLAYATFGVALLGRLLTHLVERTGRTVLRPLVAA